MRVLVIGSRGQLGSALVEEFAEAGHDVSALTRDLLDVRDEAAARRMFAALRPDAVVNATAYNDVDGAEDEAMEALAVNAIAVAGLARSAAAVSARFVHFSTDFVFDGTASAPYTEDDPPHPCNVYAASKLAGEWAARSVPGAYVLRVASLFGHGTAGPDKGTIATLARTIAAAGPVSAFVDRTVSPTFVPDAARAARLVLETYAAPAVFHCVNSGYCSWFELTREIARQLESRAPIAPVLLTDVVTRAKRPRFCALSNTRLASAGISMPSWQDAIRRYLIGGRPANYHYAQPHRPAPSAVAAGLPS